MAYCVRAEGSHTLHVNCLDGPGYRLDKLFDFFVVDLFPYINAILYGRFG